MIITKKPLWASHSVHRGIVIYQRVTGSGSAQGKWMAAHCYYDTLKKAVAGIDAIPEMNLQHYLQKPFIRTCKK